MFTYECDHTINTTCDLCKPYVIKRTEIESGNLVTIVVMYSDGSQTSSFRIKGE